MNANQDKLNHLDWSVRGRARNQTCSISLLRLFEKYESNWKSRKYSRAAQALIAISFSLWRAVFLADKTGKRANVFAQGKEFLERVIEDNAISYIQDKNAREWTFNYYTRNARSWLEELAMHWPSQVPKYQREQRGPKDRWDYCQDLLSKAVSNFEDHLDKRKIDAEKRRSIRARRTQKRQQRKTVRALTLASRKQTPSP
jgi:hypothetical protein